jgi:hypothetical protein
LMPSIVTMRVSRPNGQMTRLGYDYFVTSVPTVVLPDQGTACSGDCQYCKYDGNYERFHFSTPFDFEAVNNCVSIDIRH